jgi:hypothetical protein
MIKEEKVITKFCDACGKETKQFLTVGEDSRTSIVKIVFNRWYGGTYIMEDLCPKCHEKILNFLDTSGFLLHLIRKDD